MLERLLHPGETVWEIERNGSHWSALFPERFLAYGRKFDARPRSGTGTSS